MTTGQCIYCRGPTDHTAGLAHVLAEAVVKNALTLPRGAVCDDCNRKLGKLDQALVQHPAIAVFIQFGALPGKDGRPRKHIGGIDLDCRADGNDLQLGGTVREMTTDAAGKRTVRVEIPPPHSFDMLKFR